MKIIVKASDGHEIVTTKRNLRHDLLSYIIENLPEDNEIIRGGRAKISALKREIASIKRDVAEKTRYVIPVL